MLFEAYPFSISRYRNENLRLLKNVNKMKKRA